MHIYLSDDIPKYDLKGFEKNMLMGVDPSKDQDNRRTDLERPTFMSSEEAKYIWNSGEAFEIKTPEKKIKSRLFSRFSKK